MAESNLHQAQKIISAYYGRAFLDAANGVGDYSEFKDRTVAELYDAITRDIEVIED